MLLSCPVFHSVGFGVENIYKGFHSVGLGVENIYKPKRLPALVWYHCSQCVRACVCYFNLYPNCVAFCTGEKNFESVIRPEVIHCG